MMWVSGVALLLLALAIVVARSRVLMITVRGDSMLPTFSDGDRLLVRRGHHGGVGDVVVFTHPTTLASGPDLLVKRVAAVPGDTVPEVVRTVVGCTAVPPGQLVVLGDNARSIDSRKLGFIREDAVVGIVGRRLGRVG